MAPHAHNPSTQEAEPGGLLQVGGQPGIHIGKKWGQGDSLGVGDARGSKVLTCSEHRPERMCTQLFPLLVENLLQSVKLCGAMSSVQPGQWPLYLSYEPLLEPGADKMPLFLLWATFSALAISVICRVCDLSTDAGGSR